MASGTLVAFPDVFVVILSTTVVGLIYLIPHPKTQHFLRFVSPVSVRFLEIYVAAHCLLGICAVTVFVAAEPHRLQHGHHLVFGIIAFIDQPPDTENVLA